MTYRERREARAERLREWADKRREKTRRAQAASDDAVAGIPFGQPVLRGHHSQKRHERALERSQNAMRAAVEHGRMAEEMTDRATTIEAQAQHAIYSDDPDAVERLKEKIGGLEAQRNRIKAYNASCRKAAKTAGQGDTSLLDEQQRQSLATTARVCPYQIGVGGSFPTYELRNLGGNINRLRKRLAELQSTKQAIDRTITARYGGSCADCGARLERGQLIRYSRENGARCAPACSPEH